MWRQGNPRWSVFPLAHSLWRCKMKITANFMQLKIQYLGESWQTVNASQKEIIRDSNKPSPVLLRGGGVNIIFKEWRCCNVLRHFEELLSFKRKCKCFVVMHDIHPWCEMTRELVLQRFPLTPDRCLASLQPHQPRSLHVYDGAEIYWLRVTGILFSHSFWRD